MNLIKTCPSCNKKIRFPIDKGKIKVKCSCGYSFVADPDDTSIYKNGKFDLEGKKKHQSGLISRIEKACRSVLKGKSPGDVIINSFLNAKYKLQNFRLLPGSEQKKIILIFIAVMIIIIAVIVLITSIGEKPGENVVLKKINPVACYEFRVEHC